MDAKQLNQTLRDMFNNMIKSGTNKRQLSMFTLGANNVAQFDKFIKGTDLGIKPLSRIMEAFGYKLHLVPLPESENHRTEEVDGMTREFFEACSYALSSSLEEYTSRKASNGSTRGKPPVVRNAINGFVEDLLEKM